MVHDNQQRNYENALYQYLFFHSFIIGWRVPSEIISMTIDNVIIESGQIIILETKKSKSLRTLIPENAILKSKVHKSFKNWLYYWRPKVENHSFQMTHCTCRLIEDHLLLDTLVTN